MSQTLINKNQAGEGFYTEDNLVAGDGISFSSASQQINYTVVGSPTINSDFVASGFSTSDYILGPQAPTGTITSALFKLKFTTPDTLYSFQALFGQTAHNRYTPQIDFDDYGNFEFCVSEDGSGWKIVSGSLAPNTTYYVKAMWNGTYIRLYASTDDVNYSQIGSDVSCSNMYWAEQMAIGIDYGEQISGPFNGSIYLQDFYVEINGEPYWKAVNVAGTSINANIKTINSISLLGSGNISIQELPSQTGNSGKFLTTDGTNASWATVQGGAEYAHQGFSIIGSDVQIDNDNIASGFSSYGTNNVNNSHLLVPTLPSSITTMEMYCKFKVTGDMTLANTPYPLFLPDTTTLGQALYVQAAASQSARVLSLWDGSINYTGTTVIDANTDYEMKATYVNGYFTTYIKVSGSWVQQFQCSSNIFSGYAVGIGGSYGSDRNFVGDIYLDDTSIYINGSRWFTGAKIPSVIDMRSVVGYDSSKTQVLKNIQGTLTWVDAA